MASHSCERALFAQQLSTACADVDGYVLFNEEAGWDVSGNNGSKKVPRGKNLLFSIKFCIEQCEDRNRCSGFAYNNGICWFKSPGHVGNTPKFIGNNNGGWTWYYNPGAHPGQHLGTHRCVFLTESLRCTKMLAAGTGTTTRVRPCPVLKLLPGAQAPARCSGPCTVLRLRAFFRSDALVVLGSNIAS